MWRIVGASVTGTSHLTTDLPCQDAHFHRRLASGMALVAVADGLGTAARSDRGSRLAVDTVVEELATQLREPFAWSSATSDDLKARMVASFAAARRRLEQEATAGSIPLRDLGTTLMAVACSPKWLLVGHIGDGAVIGVWGDDRLKLLSEPQRGEYANVTTPLTMDNALARVYCDVVTDPPTTVMLMSDGLQNLALDLRANVPFEGFVRPLVDGIGRIDDEEQANQSLVDFLESDRVNSRTDDDKTLVILTRVAGRADQVILPVPVHPEPSQKSEGTQLVPGPSGDPAAALEAKAYELDREAWELEERGRTLLADLSQIPVNRKIEKQTWKTIKEHWRVAGRKREQADEMRAKARALRRR